MALICVDRKRRRFPSPSRIIGVSKKKKSEESAMRGNKEFN